MINRKFIENNFNLLNTKNKTLWLLYLLNNIKHIDYNKEIKFNELFKLLNDRLLLLNNEYGNFSEQKEELKTLPDYKNLKKIADSSYNLDCYSIAYIAYSSYIDCKLLGTASPHTSHAAEWTAHDITYNYSIVNKRVKKIEEYEEKLAELILEQYPIDLSNQVDWRLGEVLPEDYYAL